MRLGTISDYPFLESVLAAGSDIASFDPSYVRTDGAVLVEQRTRSHRGSVSHPG